MDDRVEFEREHCVWRIRKHSIGFLLGLILGVCGVNAGASIQLSFLDDPEVIEDTIDRLSRAGCGRTALDGFRSLIARQNQLIEIPKSDDVTWFDSRLTALESVEDLYALGAPSYSSLVRWRQLPRRHLLTCFDLALLLLREGPVSAECAFEAVEAKYLRQLQTFSKGGVQHFEVANLAPRDASFIGGLLSSSQIYSSQTQLPSRSINESHLALSLRSVRATPGHSANTARALSQLFEEKVNLWRKDCLSFSEAVRIVQCHFVDLRDKFMGVDHIGLLLKKERGWMYVEKNGSTHPVVRIDFESIDQLLDYLSKMFEEDQYDPRSPLHQAAFLISINEDVHRTILRNRVGILQEDEGLR